MGITPIESIYVTATKERVEINDSQQSNCENKTLKNNIVSWADVVRGKSENVARLNLATTT